MLQEIKPGSRIHVKIASAPTNVAAAKTLVRLLRKDKAAAMEDRRQTRLRKIHYKPGRRGGRLYGGHMVKIENLKGVIGEEGTITATADVLTDLKSVSRFIEVTAA